METRSFSFDFLRIVHRTLTSHLKVGWRKYVNRFSAGLSIMIVALVSMMVSYGVVHRERANLVLLQCKEFEIGGNLFPLYQHTLQFYCSINASSLSHPCENVSKGLSLT